MGSQKFAISINSVRDDFGIVFESEKERGYLSSNRPESRGKDDIFQFTLPPLEFKMMLTVKVNAPTTEYQMLQLTLLEATVLMKQNQQNKTEHLL